MDPWENQYCEECGRRLDSEGRCPDCDHEDEEEEEYDEAERLSG